MHCTLVLCWHSRKALQLPSLNICCFYCFQAFPFEPYQSSFSLHTKYPPPPAPPVPQSTLFLRLEPLREQHLPFMLTFGLQNMNPKFSFTSKCLNFLGSYLLWCLFSSKYVISVIFCCLTCNCISGTYFVGFQPGKTLFVLCF